MKGMNDILSCGFKPLIEPAGNWFGVSTYHPDNSYYKGNKEIRLSLQGLMMPFKYDEDGSICEKFLEVAKSRACKYIAFIESDKILYQNWFGELPSEQFINDFLTK